HDGSREVEQRRLRARRAHALAAGYRRRVDALRDRPPYRQRIPWRVAGRARGSQALAHREPGHAVLRLWPPGYDVAARARLRCDRSRRRPASRVDARARRGAAGRAGDLGPHRRRLDVDARIRGVEGRHGLPRGCAQLPRRRQDRHDAQGRSRRLRRRSARRDLRRVRSCNRPAPRRRSDDRRAARRRLSRRRHCGARVRQHRFRRAACARGAARRAAGAGYDRRRPSAGEAMMAAFARRECTLGDLLGKGAGGYSRLAITDLTLDSRAVQPGAAFVALRGGREHGAKYARAALDAGAAIVLFEPGEGVSEPPQPSLAVPQLKARLGELARAFFMPAAAPTIVGVTGTNGKTTVAYLVAQVLSQPQRPCAYVGTLGYGVPPVLTTHAFTTPDCLTLHRELAELGVPRVAMEVSSHALNQQRVAGLTFHTAVFTNLTRDHLDEHGDLESYGEAKRKLFTMPGLEYAVLNADDAFAATIAAGLAPSCELVRTSVRSSAVELSARLERSTLAGVELAVGGKFGTARLASKLIGAFNAENLLSALGALLAQGMALPAACAALAAAKPAPGRMEVLGGPPGRPWIVVDYAHTPDALQRVLTTLEDAATGELWCVFGCGGDRDRGKRR